MTPRFCLCLLLALGFAGCSTPDSRIQKNQASFSQLSPADQERIRRGEVAVGFTADMVTMALGEPDRRFTRTTDRGTVEVWAYQKKSPAFSVGLGVGGGGGGTRVGTGVGVQTGGGEEDRLRLVLEGGRVTSIEQTVPPKR